jgi:UDP-arabinose 4-epimerase
MKNKNILVTGGAGYIGSHTCKLLHENGYNPIVFDNLSRGNKWSVKWGPFIEGDINDTPTLIKTLQEYQPFAVIHFAAFAYIGESVEEPGKYYHNNVNGSFSLLNAIADSQVKNIIFSSSCSTYGLPESLPIEEDQLQNPISPYGHSKLIIEKSLKYFYNAKKINSVSLRYFNAAGADSSGMIGEYHVPETHIIPLLFDVAVGKKESFSIFGTDYPTEDGTCIRDYIHVEDLANAHVLALKYIEKQGYYHYFNVGTGNGYSVQEMIKKVEEITKKKIRTSISKRRSGDAPVLIAKAERIRKIGWTPKRSNISNIVSDAWKWYKHVATSIENN